MIKGPLDLILIIQITIVYGQFSQIVILNSYHKKIFKKMTKINFFILKFLTFIFCFFLNLKTYPKTPLLDSEP